LLSDQQVHRSVTEIGFTEPIYSTAHPEYLDNDDKVESKVPLPESEIEAPAKDIPAAGEVSVPAEAMLTQDYMQKAGLFVVVLAVIFYVVRRRRASYQKLDEKSMA